MNVNSINICVWRARENALISIIPENISLLIMYLYILQEAILIRNSSQAPIWCKMDFGIICDPYFMTEY